MISPPERVLITGYSGFVGRHLVPLCREYYPDAELIGTSHLPIVETSPVISGIQADLRDGDQVRHLIGGSRPDLIIHLAGQASVAESWTHPEDTLAINAGGAINLLEAVHAANLSPRILLIGSAEQYGVVAPEENPIREDHPMLPVNPYAVSKVTQDLLGYQYYAGYGLPVIRVRAFNSFGPHQPPAYVISSFARQIALIEADHAGPVIRVGNLAVQRDFMAVGDVARAYLRLADSGHPGEAYNVGSGVPVSIERILEMLLSLSSVHVEVHEDPELLRPVDVPVTYADITRLQRDTGWRPMTPLIDVLRDVLGYWREQVKQDMTES
ncbi:MAG TPA: GDP-mannose 4,6-dehydratase [Ktedonobacterales bacterium]|nr:GDP-mannose 4,6-dehydratase [Ktedonobacterales bacterium]